MGDNKIESLLDEAVKELFDDIESEVPIEEIEEKSDLKKEDEKDNERSVDGLLAIKDGTLKLTPQKEEKAWPKIKVGENVSVKVGGHKIKDTSIVTDINKVEIEVVNEPPKASLIYLYLKI